MRRIPSLRLVGSVGTVLALTAMAACSGDDDAAEPSAPVVTEGDAAEDPDAEAPEADTDVDTTPAPTDAGPSPDATEQPPPTTEPEPEPERPSEPPRLAGLAPVELTTEQQGGGDRPLLEWSSVDGAAVYGVYLYAPDGSIYWTWQGAATSVYVGGESRLPDSMPGPSVVDQMSWSVVGFDADFLPWPPATSAPSHPDHTGRTPAMCRRIDVSGCDDDGSGQRGGAHHSGIVAQRGRDPSQFGIGAQHPRCRRDLDSIGEILAQLLGQAATDDDHRAGSCHDDRGLDMRHSG